MNPLTAATCLLLVALACGASFPHLQRVLTSPKSSPAEQAAAVVAMIARLLPPERTGLFLVTVDPGVAEPDGRDAFVLEAAGDQIHITGSSGVAAAWGFQYYAKSYCGAHFSWSGDQASIPASPPAPAAPERVLANDLLRYYQNVCTVSYSFVWWDWDRWERELDWMALNGINLPLAFGAQEAIWRRVFLQLNLTEPELDAFFAGPAFEAWGRMGNLDAWGGPIPEAYHQAALQTQHRVLDRMRAFGMTPVLPCFSGHVPEALTRVQPQANVTRLQPWNGFAGTYLLDSGDPLFATLGAALVAELAAEFGVDHVYNCDTFNEMTPPSGDPAYVAAVGAAVYGAMTAADPDAVWLMQGWLFLDEYWTPERVRALVTSVPQGRMLVLDLHSDVRPLYQDFESYYGQPFVWCMLHNFGGTKGLYGALADVNAGPFAGRGFPNGTMVGTGLTPEGIEQNDVVYEFMNELAWRQQPVADLGAWAGAYAGRRYGAPSTDAEAAWRLLVDSAYNCSGFSFHGQFIMVSRPGLELQPYLCYDAAPLLQAWDAILLAAGDATIAGSDLFQHDLVDVSREALTLGFDQLYGALVGAFNADDIAAFEDAGAQLLDLLLDAERLLATDRRFLLGAWLGAARNLSASGAEAAQYEYNARNQVTLWGPDGQILDYGTKMWSGVALDYYRPRWLLFEQTLYGLLGGGEEFNQTEFDRQVFEQVEEPFTFATKEYPADPTGDPVAVAQELYAKWRDLFGQRPLPVARTEAWEAGPSGQTYKAVVQRV